MSALDWAHVARGLDEPGVDYTGGELAVVEQRPRSRSRATCTAIERGHAIVFTTRDPRTHDVDACCNTVALGRTFRSRSITPNFTS